MINNSIYKLFKLYKIQYNIYLFLSWLGLLFYNSIYIIINFNNLKLYNKTIAILLYIIAFIYKLLESNMIYKHNYNIISNSELLFKVNTFTSIFLFLISLELVYNTFSDSLVINSIIAIEYTTLFAPFCIRYSITKILIWYYNKYHPSILNQPSVLLPLIPSEIYPDNPNCPICLEYISKSLQINDINNQTCLDKSYGCYLTCNHEFHISCLIMYKETCIKDKRQLACPLCRTEIIFNII
jgi:hypothetical protein